MSEHCDFCGVYNASVFADKEWRKIEKRHKEKLTYHDWTVALCERSWTKEDGKKYAFKHLILKSETYGIGYKLNYCPECGRKLKGEHNV